MGFYHTLVRGRPLRHGDRPRPRIPGQGCGFPHPFPGCAGQRADNDRVAVRLRRHPDAYRRGARPQPYRCTGGERHRLHRRRYDHHPPPVGARAYDGGKPLGDGRHRPCGRGAYVCRGCSCYGADALRARSAYAGLWRVGAPQDDGGLFGYEACCGRRDVQRVAEPRICRDLL